MLTTLQVFCRFEKKTVGSGNKNGPMLTLVQRHFRVFLLTDEAGIMWHDGLPILAQSWTHKVQYSDLALLALGPLQQSKMCIGHFHANTLEVTNSSAVALITAPYHACHS